VLHTVRKAESTRLLIDLVKKDFFKLRVCTVRIGLTAQLKAAMDQMAQLSLSAPKKDKKARGNATKDTKGNKKKSLRINIPSGASTKMGGKTRLLTNARLIGGATHSACGPSMNHCF
jgi:PBP1b-binding outer membrane lipoprotein LpoB